MLEKLKEHWQLLTILLLLWSFFDLYNYYHGLGIEIQQYISTGEIILLALPTLLKGIFIFIIIFFYSILGVSTRKPNNTIYSEPEPIWAFGRHFKYLIADIKERKLLRSLLSLIGLIMSIGTCAFFLFILFSGWYYLFVHQSFDGLKVTHQNKWYLLFFFTFFGTLPIVFLIHDYIEKPSKILLKKISFNNSPILYFLLIFILNSYLSNKISHILILHGTGPNQVYFKKDQSHFSTDSNMVYIGSTTSYLFFHNNKDSNNFVINRASIDSLVLK